MKTNEYLNFTKTRDCIRFNSSAVAKEDISTIIKMGVAFSNHIQVKDVKLEILNKNILSEMSCNTDLYDISKQQAVESAPIGINIYCSTVKPAVRDVLLAAIYERMSICASSLEYAIILLNRSTITRHEGRVCFKNNMILCGTVLIGHTDVATVTECIGDVTEYLLDDYN